MQQVKPNIEKTNYGITKVFFFLYRKLFKNSQETEKRQ